MYYSKHFMGIISFNPLNNPVRTIIFLLQMRKLKHGEVKCVSQELESEGSKVHILNYIYIEWESCCLNQRIFEKTNLDYTFKG